MTITHSTQPQFYCDAITVQMPWIDSYTHVTARTNCSLHSGYTGAEIKGCWDSL